MEEAKKENTETKKTETTYSKAQLVQSQKYKNKRDILNSILDDNKRYTFKEVNALIDNFLRKKVK